MRFRWPWTSKKKLMKAWGDVAALTGLLSGATNDYNRERRLREIAEVRAEALEKALADERARTKGILEVRAEYYHESPGERPDVGHLRLDLFIDLNLLRRDKTRTAMADHVIGRAEEQLRDILQHQQSPRILAGMEKI